MKLTAPIFRLKRQSRLLARAEGVPLHEAQDRIAQDEGFQRWSQLAAHHAKAGLTKNILNKLVAGDLVLFGARRGQGKTALAFELVAEAIKSGRRSVYFSLDETNEDLRERSRAVGIATDTSPDIFTHDTSEDISAPYIIEKVENPERGTLIVIDYLQLLDQQRHKPDVSDQVAALSAFAQSTGAIIIFISQIDRTFESSDKAVPDLEDVRLPNPVDLGLFTKTCFFNDGEIRFEKSHSCHPGQ